jgi:phosphoribosylformylglycinamidine synthase
VGAEPLAVTDNLNFGSPEKPIGYWQLAESCRGIAEACKDLGTPVTGGNVSLYNETLDAEGKPASIYPTPVIGMVGLIPDLTKICGQSWQESGDLIYLLGNLTSEDSKEDSDLTTNVTLGGSEYLAVIHGVIAGKPPRVNLDLERRVQAACRVGIRNGWVRSAHDCAEGGIAIALAESCIATKLGAEVNLNVNLANVKRWDEILFGERGNTILVSVAPANEEVWVSYLEECLPNLWQKLGQVGTVESPLRVVTTDRQSVIEVTIQDMRDRYYNSIERRLGSA